jgi:TolB-like protein/tetratricopeptide (TPR) repeat protein
MNRFIEELKRRHVIRVAGVYTVVAWVLAQVAGVVEAGLGLPGWFDGFILATLALGFPVALILAWAFEMTPEGVRRTSDLDPRDPGATPVRARTTDYATLGALLVLTALVAVDVWPGGTPGNPGVPGATGRGAGVPAAEEGFVPRTGGEGPPTIAVMPFVNMSEDPGNAYFADGISEEILNALARIDGLVVVARTSSFALREAEITVPEIGERLLADLVLEGSVRTQGERVRVAAQLIETVGGTHLWSEVYERNLDDLFGVQDEVTAEIASTLPGLIGIAPLEAPTPTTRTVDPEAYRLYLQARYAYDQMAAAFYREDLERAFEYGAEADSLVKRALELDPELAGGWTLRAALVRVGGTRAYQERYPTLEASLQAASDLWERALELDPDAVEVLVGEAYVASRFDWDWAEASALYERALAVDPESATAHTDYAYHLTKVGRCREALGHARLGAQLDPGNGWRRLAEARILPCLGRSDEALDAFAELLRGGETSTFNVRDMFLTGWVDQDADALRRLRHLIVEADWPVGDSIQSARRGEFLALTDAGVEAIEGDPAPMIALVDREVAAHDAAVAAGEDVDRRQDDLWVWSMYYAWAGASDEALALYLRALDAEVLYIPHTFRHGPFEFPEPMRSDPRYLQPWQTRPELAELARLRLDALEAGEMAAEGSVIPVESAQRPVP